MERTHGVTHYDPDNCFGCHVQTIQYSPSCFPSTPGGRKVAQDNKAERQLGKDLDSFKRLTVGGTMPKRIDGSARFEQEAQVPYEIESGQLASQRAKGPDATRGGREWARRAQSAHEELTKTGTIDMSS